MHIVLVIPYNYIYIYILIIQNHYKNTYTYNYIYIYIYTYIHIVPAGGSARTPDDIALGCMQLDTLRTDASYRCLWKKQSSGGEGLWEKEPSELQSQGGYQFLLLDCRAKGSCKRAVFSLTPVLSLRTIITLCLLDHRAIRLHHRVSRSIQGALCPESPETPNPEPLAQKPQTPKP